MIFDPIKKYSYASDSIEMLAEEIYSDDKPMGNIAVHNLNRIIFLLLIGANREVVYMLPERLTWLEKAIIKKEDYGESLYFHLMNLHAAAAMYSWLITAKNENFHLGMARYYNELTVKDETVYGAALMFTIRMDEYMLYSYFSGEYEKAVLEYEKNNGFLTSEKNIAAPRDLVYALCRHKLEGVFDAAKIFLAGRKVLSKNLQSKWLGCGQGAYAAKWLNFLYGTFQPELSPREIVLKAYDDMPKVQRPSFVR